MKTMLAVTDFIDHTVKVWGKSPETLPEFEKTYTSGEQELREENFQQFQQKLEGLKSRENVRTLQKEDTEGHTKTMFSCRDKSITLGAFVNKTINLKVKIETGTSVLLSIFVVLLNRKVPGCVEKVIIR